MNQLIQTVNNKPMTTSLVIAELFDREHKNVIQSIESLVSDGLIGGLDSKPTSYTDKSNRQSKMYELTERGFLIAMPFIGGNKAKQGQTKLVDAFLSYRQQSLPVEQNTFASMLEIQVIESVSRMFRMSDSSKIGMLRTVCEDKGINARFMPDYVDEGRTDSLEPLLKENGSKLSARAANPILIAMSVLEEVQRKSSRNTTKKFKSFTDLGLQFGKNETSPRSPNQT